MYISMIKQIYKKVTNNQSNLVAGYCRINVFLGSRHLSTINIRIVLEEHFKYLYAIIING